MRKYFAIFGIIFVLAQLVWVPRISADDATQPSNSPCYPFLARYGMFDDYERITYDHGLLQIHLRVLRPIYNPLGWLQSVTFYSADCNKTEQYDINFSQTDMWLPGLMQDYSVRFSSRTHFDIWNDENNTKIDCTACSVDIPATFANGTPYTYLTYYAHTGDYRPLELSTSSPVQVDYVPNEPILIIPGMLSTRLNKDEQEVWLNVAKMILDPKDDFLNSLEMDSNGKPIEASVQAGDVIDKIGYVFGDFHYSDLLVKEFVDKGYKLGEDLFLWGYDWRLSAAENSKLLKNKIADLTSSGIKINIVAHSMGGLILKDYLANNSDDTKIDKVFFAGTPNLGSEKAAKLLLFGDNMGVPLLSAAKLQSLATNMPSIYDLIPSQQYYKYSAGFYDDLTNPALKTIFTYQDSKGLLLANNKNSHLINQSESWHLAADELDLSAKPYQAYNLVGCGVYTEKTITKMYAGQPTLGQKIIRDTKYRITADTGDGTVLLPSAMHLNLGAGKRWFFPGAVHTNMLSDKNVIDFIVSKVTGEERAVNASLTSENCGLDGKLISFDSKVDLKIIDQNGKSVVPGVGADLQKIGDQSFLYLPTDSGKKYKVEATPKDSKPITTQVTEYKNNNSKNYYYNDINLNGGQTLNIDVGGDGETLEKVDPTDSAPEPVAPDQVTEDTDSTPPTTSVKRKDGTLAKEGLLSLNLNNRTLVFNATDDNPGTVTTLYSVDDGASWQLVLLNHEILIQLGQDKILFFSVDKSQNQEEIQELNFDWLNDTQTQLPSTTNTDTPTTNTDNNTDDSEDPIVDQVDSEGPSINDTANDTAAETEPDGQVLSAYETSTSPGQSNININLSGIAHEISPRPIENNYYLNQDPYLFLWQKLRVSSAWVWKMWNLMIF